MIQEGNDYLKKINNIVNLQVALKATEKHAPEDIIITKNYIIFDDEENPQPRFNSSEGNDVALEEIQALGDSVENVPISQIIESLFENMKNDEQFSIIKKVSEALLKDYYYSRFRNEPHDMENLNEIEFKTFKQEYADLIRINQSPSQFKIDLKNANETERNFKKKHNLDVPDVTLLDLLESQPAKDNNKDISY